MFDLAIIGAGPAGLSAAIHAKRFGLNCVVLERGTVGGQACAANWITNYPGFPNGITGRDLMELFVKQAEEVGVKFERCEVSRVSLRGSEATEAISRTHLYSGDCFADARNDSGVYKISTSKDTFESKAVFLATGLEPIRLPLPFGERVGGEGVFYYPDPDDVPHDGKNVLVIGGGDSAFDEALSFSKKAMLVTIAMRSDRPRALSSLVKAAKEAGIKIKKGLSESAILKMRGDVVVACIGKIRRLDILEEGLRSAVEEELLTRTYLTGFLQLAGDIAHPNIRHIGCAVGDGIEMAEKMITSR